MPATAANRDLETLRQLRALGEQWQGEVETLGKQLNELKMLLRQTVSEIDRLSLRSSQASQRLRDMEAHIESYTRADIKDTYSTAQEAQMRLFMMQLQQEQIEHKQKTLTAYHAALGQVVALAEQVAAPAGGGKDKAPETSGQPAVSTLESTAKIIEAQEDERRKVSRQIHDGPAQTLANIVLRAQICERLMEKDREQALRELQNLQKLVTNSLQETRQFIFDLRPMILDDLGLVPTMRRYCEMLSESSRTPVRFGAAGNERRLGTAAEVAIFRMLQEAIRNALEHGQPGVVQVSLEMEPQGIQVVVQDDGRGCDGEAALAAAREGRTTGLARIEDYVRSLNGTLSFKSEPARGCTLLVTVPAAAQGK